MQFCIVRTLVVLWDFLSLDLVFSKASFLVKFCETYVLNKWWTKLLTQKIVCTMMLYWIFIYILPPTWNIIGYLLSGSIDWFMQYCGPIALYHPAHLSIYNLSFISLLGNMSGASYGALAPWLLTTWANHHKPSNSCTSQHWCDFDSKASNYNVESNFNVF